MATLKSALLLGFVAVGCASIPPDRYGINDIEIEGNEIMDGEALASCLATYERSRVTLQLGAFGLPKCEQPPFEGHPTRIRLWRWPWSDWPLYDELIFQRDLERVLRWYEARGFPDAQVIEVRIEPATAADSDEVPDEADCRDGDADEGCEVNITVVVDEGQPVLVTSVQLLGTETLPAALVERLQENIRTQEGERWDEAFYEESKVYLQWALEDESYARAEVEGRVVVDRDLHTAEVTILVTPGPPCTLGDITVEGAQDLPVTSIEAAAELETGDVYDPEELRDAQAAVYDLGAFSSVVVEPRIPDEGDRIDIAIQVQPAGRSRFQLGAGIESGVARRRITEEVEQVPQWDTHAVATWEHRNLFGGLRQFRIEERPRIISNQAFPQVDEFEPGNILSLVFEQPGFFEPRTTFIIDSRWELGPDPFLQVFRHEVDVGATVQREWADQILFTSFGVRENLYYAPTDEQPPPPLTAPASSDLLFLEQVVRLDLRNDPLRTRSGGYFSVSLQEAGYFLPSSWDYFRIVPEARGYLPLPGGILLASRISVGALFLSDADPSLDLASREIGPTAYRLRGGGTSSNRGFGPGQLGDGQQGGTRRWLAAAEIRLPLFQDFYITPFADMGDVSSEPEFRFDHLQLSVGLGFRLLTLLGPIRLDFGWRVPGAQVLGDDERSPGGRLTRVDLLLFDFPGALNLTLGDSF